ncbi:hypothetical protein L1987_42357 [Smallanthus sonchifolius]|uniref:Uncharacterized protein n=1 Tax=Smallanthus sonchifolius TaxID=185202 RepID=A0ACB9GJM1_9ASTR|nr:hypothetical protein L1987_42357 [Smallanthus sonchifolius]
MTTIQIISKENIIPSSPTPQHLKSYNLSILDQLIPAPYAPIILYYPNDQANLDIQESLKSLKDSLSKTLTRFYPLAGSIKNDLLIDCDDVGAYFAVARVNTRLDEFLSHPDLDLINHFLPCEPSFNGSSEGSCMGKSRTTRFVFEPTKLAILKAKACENGLKDPTRVEVVSGLLRKCVMAAFEEKTGSWKPSLLSHVVNLRKRLVSTLSENSIGNLIFIASAKCDMESQTALHDLVGKVRDGVSKISGEFVKKLQGDEGVEVMEEALKGPDRSEQ